MFISKIMVFSAVTFMLTLIAATVSLVIQRAELTQRCVERAISGEGTTQKDEKKTQPEWLRVSAHPLANGDVVFDAYTADNTMAYCWMTGACRGRSLRPDRLEKGEGCIGYLVCTKDPKNIGLPAGLELGEAPHPAPECDMDVKGK